MTGAVGVVVVVGTAGSGKSTLARLIARRYGALYLDKDSMLSELVGFGLESNGYRGDDRESNSFYRDRIMPLEYRSLFRVAGDNLRMGTSVVLDAPFAAYLGDPAFISSWASEGGWPPVSPVVVRIIADEELVRRRIVARANPRDAWKIDNWDEFWSAYARTDCRWDGVTIVDLRNDDQADPDFTGLDAVLELP